VTNEYGRYGPEPDIELGWDELTGRLGVDWSPALSFTDQTLVYAFYSRGYKGGGANPPPAKNQNADLQAVTPAIFDPEYVDAFEIGSKNTILGGSMTLNGSAFYYDYQDYQVSKVQDRTVVNENFDAKVWGAELEALWRPLPQVTMNAAVGYLRTRIADGERSLDIFNRAQGRPGWMTVTPYVQQTSNCIMPVEALADAVNGARALKEIFEQIGLFADDAFHLGTGYRGSGSCGGYWFDHEYDAEIQRDIITPSAENLANPEAHGGQGFLADIGGNELPNSPRWTLSLGADYTWDLKSGWAMTLRGDYYQQTSSWSRVYAEESDRLRGWDNVNFSLTFAQPDKNLAMQVYVKNAFDETPVTDAFLNSDSTGMTTNIFTLDPRLIGVSVRVGF
jgi:iron complex outermembrane receptor protein